MRLTVGYDVYQPEELGYCKLNEKARRIVLKIESQAVVNRLFNMPVRVLDRKVIAAVMQKNEFIESSLISNTHFAGAELQDDGDISLWAYGAEYDRQKSEGDALDALGEMPSWDQEIIAIFASQVTEQSHIYRVEMRDANLDVLDLRRRKRRAEVITELVKHNVAVIPSLHIDVVKNVIPKRRAKKNISRALILCFSNPFTANEVVSHGLQWQGSLHSCEVHDPKFFDRCGRCQLFGHHKHDCQEPFRCAKCTGQHQTQLCTSNVERCALCDAPHWAGGSQCSARRARKLEKPNARFPTGQDQQPFTIHMTEPEGSRPSLDPPATDLSHQPVEHASSTEEGDPDPKPTHNHTAPPDPHVGHTSTTEECDPDPKPTSANTARPDTPTLLARQLQDRIPAIEGALWSNVCDMERKAMLSATKTAPRLGTRKREKRRKVKKPAPQIGLLL